MYTLSITEPFNNILIATTKTQYEISATLMRFQEFYESPSTQIRGKYFSREYFEDLYAQKNGNFTYYQDWSGFNIPGNILYQFWKLFWNDFSVKEARFFDKLYEATTYKKKDLSQIYLIGFQEKYYNSDYYLHELCHALYYLDQEYKTLVHAFIYKQLPKELRYKITKTLKKWGYSDEVIIDEINAYLATSDYDYLNTALKIDVQKYEPHISNLRYMFEYFNPTT